MSNEVINESAKAAQEIAKTTSNAIDAGREMGGFVSRFIAGPLEQASGIIEDKLRYMRWERQVRLVGHANDMIKEKGLNSPDKPLPLKHAIPLLEYATLEESNDLQDKWASLLVNTTCSDTGITIERSYIEILAQLSSFDAQILDKIYSLPFDDASKKAVVTENLPEEVMLVVEGGDIKYSEPKEEVVMALANLSRLGCVKLPLTWGNTEIFSQVNPTYMGKKFVEACTLR